jgi:hypothetical protein
MKPPPAPSLLEVIRLLLHKVEESSYPNSDPLCIQNLKAHLRCRIAELEVEEVLALPPAEKPERSSSVFKDDWWLPLSQRESNEEPLNAGHARDLL